MAFDVFISHSSKDKTTADAVCAVLESRKVRCWIAPRDIQPGAEWGESILEAIRSCSIMVLVFSKNANASVQIKREVERAVHHGATIIPVRIQDILPTGTLEFSISTAHWLDAFTPPLEQHLNFLADTVVAVLEGKAKPKPKPAPKPSLASAWRTPIIVGSILALAILALILKLSIPPSVQGDWVLDQPTITATVTSSLSDLITAALTGPNVKGDMTIKSLGVYSLSITATDSGTVTPAKTGNSGNAQYDKGLTFVSKATGKSITVNYMLNDNANGAYAAFGVPAGEKIVMFGYNTGAGTVVTHGTSDGTSGGSGGLDPAIVGTWKGTPFNMNPPNNLWGGALVVQGDGIYVLTVTHQESGIVTAVNGSWTAKPASTGMFGMAGPSVFNDMGSGASYSLSSTKLLIASPNGTLNFRRGW